MEKQVILSSNDALIGADLTPAYKAVRSNQFPAGIVARFKKKEDISCMAKSILKHKIQTLTGKSVKNIEDEMDYKPKDPNEPSMDIDTMRRLASSLVLLANNELPNYRETESKENHEIPPQKVGSKRSSAKQEEADVLPKSSRRSLAANSLSSTSSNTNTTILKAKSRRSIAVVPSTQADEKEKVTVKRGRKSIAAVQELNTLPRSSRRSAAVSTRNSQHDPSDKNASLSSSYSDFVTNCLGPASTQADNLALIEEDNEPSNEELDSSLVNPTPLMKEMLIKKKSVVPKNSIKKSSKAIAKEKTPSPVRAPSPAPRAEFKGANNASAYLVSGDPMDLKLTKLMSTLPISARFPGAHLTVVHTPADWTPTEVFQVSKQIKQLNREAGLANFVVLFGTGLDNVHMNMEALLKHTKHVQFVTFHREDANIKVETGKLRETTSFFLVGYIFPGCEMQDSKLPSKMVRDGYTTCFRTEGIAHLERSIIDCFSETGEWLLDLCCGTRQLCVTASEKGRNAVALHNDALALEDLGNYLRTLSLKSDNTYRDKDGLVLKIINQ